MTLKSMTGFARISGTAPDYDWVWELKSVNNKNLDIRMRLPAVLDGFDIKLKKNIGAQIARGTVFANLTLSDSGAEGGIVINEKKLEALIKLATTYSGQPHIAPASLDGLLRVKGVVEEREETLDEDQRSILEDQIMESLNAVITKLISDRSEEGERMQQVLKQQLADIEALTKAARDHSGDRTISMQTRFAQQLDKLQSVSKPVDDERLAQEIALLAVKADIMEELDRLDSHVTEAKKLLDSVKPVGRRLDFLCQEFNREANTLCAKSGDTKLTKIGLDIKTLIDQFREQVQNIE
ncbi:YicC/YloC family endoribonuclease [Kordiimonas sp. SCSIO 12610]|uniref:YicC/YloC family endoribonuclease n=1 Tax=Kordiimonas sp. SCSIO 12610 TaxID=2829597 RepID=UPI00210B1B54|nr:YicC/YloC family endoribonuclease [Kordiimonas sp. SCSIO 12610]UTW53870.1 YicC family protein [Kordiimonas sp. SCSIO 12610]